MPKNTFEYGRMEQVIIDYNPEDDLIVYPSTGEFAVKVTYTDITIIAMVKVLIEEVEALNEIVYELKQRIAEQDRMMEEPR